MSALVAADRDDFQFGEPQFDERVSVCGAPGRLAALLDFGTRARILRLVTTGAGSARIEGGVVVREVRGRVQSADAAEAILLDAVDVVKQLRIMDQEPRAALLRIASSDPSSLAKARALAHAARLGGGEDLLAVARAFLDDPDVDLRWTAATIVGDLPTLARLAGIEELGADRREAAILQVERVLTSGRAATPGEALAAALERTMDVSPADSIRSSATRSLFIFAPDRARRWLAAPDPTHPAQALRFVQAASAVLGDDAEAAVIPLLRHPATRIQEAAAVLLGEIGTRVSLPALHELADVRLGLTVAGRAARAAIDLVHARLGPVEPGRLSLIEASDTAGAVSLPAERGALAVARKTEHT